MKKKERNSWILWRSLLLILLLMITWRGEAQTKVYNKDELKTAIENGESVLLMNEINIDYELTISKNLTLDLGGKTLKREEKAGDIICVKCTNGKITIKNGSIITKQNKTASGGNGSGLDISGADVLIQNCNITGKTESWTAWKSGTAIQYYSGTLRIINGTFIGEGNAGKGYAIWSNNITINNFLKGSYLKKDGNVVSNVNTKTIEGSVTAHPTTYTVDYKVIDGTITSSTHVKSYKALDIFDNVIQPLATVEREGYTNQWTYNDGSSTINISAATDLPYPYVTSDTHTITLATTWSPIEYKIVYKDIDGATNPNMITEYDITKDSESLAPAIKPYYDFVGWFDDEGNQIQSIVYDKVKKYESTQTYNVIARWKPTEYILSFDTKTNEVINPITYSVNATDTQLPEPASRESEGYSFVGWYDGDTKVEAIPVNSPKTMKLTAKWDPLTYTIICKEEDGKSQIKKLEYKTGQTIILDDFQKEGYIFEGWRTETNGKGNKVTQISGIGNKEVYASWTPIQYTLKYELEGGDYKGQNPITYSYLERATLPTSLELTKEAFVFSAWYLDPTYSGQPLVEAPVAGGSKTDGGRKMSFIAYAKWEENKGIMFISGGDEPVDNSIYKLEKGVTENEMPKVTRKGYIFKGWYSGDKLMTFIPANGEPIVLKAKWELCSYGIEYILNGGTNPSDSPSSYTYEITVTLPIPAKEHYDFAGWFIDPSLTNSAGDAIPQNSIENKTFYAKWTPKKYTLTFDPQGGTCSTKTQTYIYGEAAELKAKPRKSHYDFVGWCYDADCKDACGDKIPVNKSGNYTLYAKWKLTDYKIELDKYYGEFSAGTDVPVTYTYESVIEKLPEPKRNGFTFAGWYANDRLTIPVSSPAIEKGSSGNKTFYATWDRGYQVILSQSSNGKIAVTHNGNAVASGAMVGKGESLVITATPATSDYVLKQLTVNGTTYTTSPQTVVMPEKDLKITAEFTMSSVPAAPAPKIILSPAGMDKFPKGENVKVQLEKTDEATTLYYRLDGSPEKAYSGEFLVESAKDTVLLEAIAKKEGYRDGVTTRYIIFDNGKITLTFDLPLGVKATNPTGGDVVTAATTGGSFEFMLTVDKDYYTNLDSMVVSANDSTITGNASGLYTLTNCSSDITVTVSGLKAKTCTVTLQQTENGQIKFTDGADETTSEVGYGSSVSITAVADEDFKFLQWNTGSQSNPLNLTVSRDTTISARFISDYKSYMMTLPQMEGVTVKPYSGYSTEVKKDGTFKFYLVLAKGYREGNLVVRANGEELTKNKGGYAIYHINKNISISVDGIVRDSIKLTLPDHVTAKVVETMSDVAGQGLFEETMLLLQAKAPEGKIFSKWTDGKTDNPRMATAVDAAQLIPLFTDKEDVAYAKVILNQSPGAGITGAGSNMDAVKSGDVVQLKVVLLPAYSQSEVVLTADDKVLTPETSLRAASETKTYVYNLPVDKDGITVKVSGLKLNSYEVTVSQTNGGTVSAVPAGKVTHGDKVQLKAEAASGMLFVKWWDGNTLNPYPYTVASDTEVKACFVGTESTVDNESIRKDDKVSVSVTGRVLSVAVAEESALYIWDYKGSLFRNQTIPAGEYTMSLPSGVYLVKVGDKGVKKIIIR